MHFYADLVFIREPSLFLRIFLISIRVLIYGFVLLSIIFAALTGG